MCCLSETSLAKVDVRPEATVVIGSPEIEALRSVGRLGRLGNQPTVLPAETRATAESLRARVETHKFVEGLEGDDPAIYLVIAG